MDVKPMSTSFLRMRNQRQRSVQKEHSPQQMQPPATMIRIAAAFSILGAMLFWHANSNLQRNLQEEVGPMAPGGFEVLGTCSPQTNGGFLEGIRDANQTVDLGMFVKHGLHVTNLFFPEGCTALNRRELIAERTKIDKEAAWHPMWTVQEFVQSTSEHKMLAVRGTESFYKSAFNHVCNKQTPSKIEWRKKNNIDCRRKREFQKLMKLDQQELSSKHDPFRLKKIVMKHPTVKRIMLVDYTCIPDVMAAMCGGPVMSHEELGAQGNSAEAQQYVDYWTMHNLKAPWTQFVHFWDRIYEDLRQECCIELVKPD